MLSEPLRPRVVQAVEEVDRPLGGGDGLVAVAQLGALDGGEPEQVGLVLAVGEFDGDGQSLLEGLESRGVIAEGEPDLAELVENGLLGVAIACGASIE